MNWDLSTAEKRLAMRRIIRGLYRIRHRLGDSGIATIRECIAHARMYDKRRNSTGVIL